MHPAPDDGFLDLGVPRGELVGWGLLAGIAVAGGLTALAVEAPVVAGVCVAVLVLVGLLVGPPLVGRVVAHPEGHLTVQSLLGTARYEMEQIDAVVVAPVLEGEGGGPPLPVVVGAELVLLSGVDVPLPSTQVLALPFLRRRLDRQVAALPPGWRRVPPETATA